MAVRRAAVVAGVLLTVSAPAALAAGGPGRTHGASGPARTTAAVETPAVHDDEQGGNADADDPAVWVDPDDPGLSLVVGTLKEAGLDVYGTDGRRLQHLDAPGAPGEGSEPGRLNNVDIVYGFELDGHATDLALVSDRGRDRVRAYAIDPAAVSAGRPPLTDVTARGVRPVFSGDEEEVDEQRNAYGLAAYSDDDAAYAVVSRREETGLKLLRLKDVGGRVGYTTRDSAALPASFTLPGGKRWTPCADPGERPQVEGMAVDQEEHILYAAQEDVGLWRIGLDGGEFAAPSLFDKVREYGVPWSYDEEKEECVLDTAHDPGHGGRRLSADAEGLTVYHAGDGRGYVLASSQGDDTFAVYGRGERTPYVGSFTVTDGPATDSVQHSDGSTVVNSPLGRAFPKGVLVTHDGAETPADGERPGTNFKFTRWDRLAAAFPDPLTVDPDSFDPRDPG
ncbi:phytase [Streptomyces marispadix]|uniref:Phytase n=1 Tax=Streptomyces marispadix TaxID=2922868 RepID=A0ABS9T5C7_9ACTN|nr:phytase [Streptomyces marispadix]MCH6163756.1 phytase [Streptomyces marispadix]